MEGVSELGQWEPLEMPDTRSWKKLNAHILEHCQNPAELAMCYFQVVAYDPKDGSRAGYLNENLKPFPRTSFIQFGDKNWISDVSAGWFDREGQSLDVQAMELSEGFGKEISIDDIIGFVRDYRKGGYRTPHQVLVKKYEDKWMELTGFRMTEKYLIHLAEASGLLQTPEPEAVETETADVVPF